LKENLKDILSNLNTGVDQQTLLQYLQGQLSEEKKHEVEKQLLENDFELEAMEGLQQMKDQQKIQSMVYQLNRDLKARTKKRRLRRQKMELKQEPWLWITIFIMLALIIISYIIIRASMNE
jgi:hypothetical protein